MSIIPQNSKFKDFTDYHTHILPKMDDGPQDVSVSVNMLKSLKEQGVTRVCLTPHYFLHTESLESFTKRRQASFDLLLSEIEKQNVKDSVPELVLGAEVSVERDLVNQESLSDLCLGDTNLLLLEMPFNPPDDQLFFLMENIALKFNIRPVIAHLDRYAGILKKEHIYRILDIPGIIIQFNAASLGIFRRGSFVKKVMRTGVPVVFGTDCHDMKRRPPKI